MNIKTFIAAAVAALTVAACSEAPETVDETVVVEQVELNADGTVNTDVVEGPVDQPELDDGKIRPREVSEGNPQVKK